MGNVFKIEMAGRVRLTLDGGARGRIDYPWFDNMILDNGFALLLTNTQLTQTTAFRFLAVGSSSQPVQPTDVGLISPLAISTQAAIAEITRGWSDEHGYGWSKLTKSFARGAAAGNISELSVGLGDNNFSAFARALVKNESGEPITITVLSDEVLTVEWELRRWFTTPSAHTVEYLDDGILKSTTVSYTPVTEIPKTANGLGSGGDCPASATKPATSGVMISTGLAEYAFRYTEAKSNPALLTHKMIKGDVYAGSIMPDGVYATFTPPIQKTPEFTLDVNCRIQLTRRTP